MNDTVAAERYARALFEIAEKFHQDRQYEAELAAFSASLRKEPAIEKFLLSPGFGREEKRKCLERLYPHPSGVEAVLLDFFTILLNKGRFGLVHDIAAAFKKISDQAQREGVVHIKSAFILEEKQQQAILGSAERIAGYKLKVRTEVDPGIIGGAVLKIDHRILDGSVLYQVDQLKKELKTARVV